MQNMAQMFAMSRNETLGREQLLRDEVSAAAKRTDPVAAQVAFLTTAVSDLRGQLSSANDFTVDAVQQVRSELEDKVSKVDPASNAGGALPGSSSDKNMVMKTEKSVPRSEKIDDYNTQCAYCDGFVPRNIAKHCEDCDLYFHPGHYGKHKSEWPCPQDTEDNCAWCNKYIMEHEDVIECDVCLYTMHIHCCAAHSPCPDGWNKIGDFGATQPDKVDSPAPVTPPSGKEDKLNELYKQFVAEADKIRSEEDTTKYPKSPGQPGTITTFGSLPLANLGIASGATVHSGYAVQYGKPREADSVKLLPFPKPGTSFEKWWDHALDPISSATSYCTEAYRWALEVQKSKTTFAKLSESGGFVRLDALLLTALMECIPGDTHLLRQEIKKAKTLQRQTQERNITGRQVLFMVFHFFAMNQKDKSMRDTARLHKISLQNGDIQNFLYKWDEMLSLMTKRPEDDDLMNLFVLQFDLHLPKNHEFYVEYLF